MVKTVYLREAGAAYDRYRRALERAGAEVRSGADLADCDGLLLPGGGDVAAWRYGASQGLSEPPDEERDREEWALLETFLQAGKTVLGVCRGLQLVNVYLGGSLRQDLPGHSQADGRDRLHPVENLPGPLRELYGPGMVVNSAHHQGVDRLGKGLTVFQRSPDGIVEAAGDLGHRILALQWHPERLEPLGQKVFRAFVTGALWG